MSEVRDRPLSHWMAVARMGFERDFHRIFTEIGIKRAEVARRMEVTPPYISKVLNGKHGNFTLETMVKLARAIGAIVQIRLVKEGEEVVRVVDYDTAAVLDDASLDRVPVQDTGTLAEVVDIHRRFQAVVDAKEAGEGRIEVQGGARG